MAGNRICDARFVIISASLHLWSRSLVILCPYERWESVKSGDSESTDAD
jgi:hypothetical protein